MLRTNVKALTAAIEGAEESKPPDMNAGTDYIHNNIYKRLSSGEELRLSDIDWERFKPEDLDTMQELHFYVFKADESKAHAIANALRSAPPIAVAAFA